MRQKAYIAIGCNELVTPTTMGCNPAHMDAQFESIRAALKFEITTKSRRFSSEAFPKGSGPEFRNGVVEIVTALPPEALLNDLHEIEKKFARKRITRWSARTCDLDLLFYGDLILPNKSSWRYWFQLTPEQAQQETPTELILPHPRIQERSFVLAPMMDIAPDLVHPVLKKSVSELWNELSEDEKHSVHPTEFI